MRDPQRHRLLAIPLFLAIVLAACSTAAPSSESPAATPEPSASAAEATPANTDPIKIGVIDSFSGWAAGYGEYTRNMIKLAQEDFGAEVDGRPIELVEADEICSPEGGVNAANRLAGQVVAVIGPQCSGAIAAAQPVLAAAKIPYLFAGVLPKLTVEGTEWGFRSIVSDSVMMEVLAEVIKEKGFTKIAVAYGNYPFEVGEYEAFAAAWKAQGNPDPVLAVMFDGSATDFSGTIQRVAASKPDAIVVLAYEPPSGLFLKQSRQLGLEQQFFGGFDFSDDIFTDAAAGTQDGSIYVSNFIDTNPAHGDLAKRYQTAFGTPPPIVITAYVGYAVIIDALKRAGPDASAETLRDAIRATNLDTVLGKVSFTDKGELAAPMVEVGTYENGVRVHVETVQK